MSRRTPRQTAALVVDRLLTLGWGLTRAVRLPPLEIATTLRAAALMAIAEVLVRRRPLPRVAELVGLRLDLGVASDAEPFDTTTLPASARRQIVCVNRVANAWPFADGPCLRRTLVGGRMLRRHDPSIRLGLQGTDGDLVGHAWLEIDGRPLEDISDVATFSGDAAVLG